MKDFLSKVQKAVESIGKAPYDDKKTMETLSEATRKTIEYCEKLKESPSKRNKKSE